MDAGKERSVERGTRSTKDALADSFQDLVLHKPFNKITIKNITDGAGVIRPTFYNYFRDKNEVFEYILDRDLYNTLYELINLGMVEEAITMIFHYFDQNRKFYRKALEVQGQNSFKEVFVEKTYQLFLELLRKYHIKDSEVLKIMSVENIARYYSMATCLMVAMWITEDEKDNKDVDDVIKAYFYLARHSLSDFLEKDGD